MIKHLHRKGNRTAEETSRLRSDRERYQRDKPTPAQLLTEGGHAEFVPMGELMFLHHVLAQLKKERERQGLTLAQVSQATGIDQAALSRLESSAHSNPTLGTVYRIASALGKTVMCVFQDAPRKAAKSRGKLTKV